MAHTAHRIARVMAGAALLAAGLATFTPPVAAQVVPPNDRARGLVYDGLAPGRAENRCAGAFEIRGRAGEVLGCTHGPTPHRPASTPGCP